jgi:hypothetical protein
MGAWREARLQVKRVEPTPAGGPAGVVVGDFLADGFQLGDQVGGGGAGSHALEEQRR